MVENDDVIGSSAADRRAARLERHDARRRRETRPALWIAAWYVVLPVVLGLFFVSVPLAVAVAIASPLAWWRSHRRRRRLEAWREARQGGRDVSAEHAA